MEKQQQSWIESSFSKRECSSYVPSTKDIGRCRCGQTLYFHESHNVGDYSTRGKSWSPLLQTQPSPTDAYGTIDFLGGPHPNKAHYLRLAFDSRADLVYQLLTKEWGLEFPKLVISVHGGKANFELNPQLKKVFTEGLLKTAKTTGAWILTTGTNTGATRHVGDALVSERSPRFRAGRVVSIGVIPWGVVENRHLLLGRNHLVTYPAIDQPSWRHAVLNNRHACFLLADNGTAGHYGADVPLRRNLEKFISNQKLRSRISCTIPVVCVVLEGGMHTIRYVLEYVTDTPPVPVVVCEGSGRAADLLAFAHKYKCDNGEAMPAVREQLLSMIKSMFPVRDGQAEKLCREVLQCVQKKNLVTIFRLSDPQLIQDPDERENFDETILRALFRSRHLSAAQQLSLALTWNRADIASREIFRYGQVWPRGVLEEAMMDALVKNRVDFVRLLLENGLEMHSFLSIPRLEELYNSTQGPSNTLRYIVRDVRSHLPANYTYTLIDIGLVINKLMGGAFRSYYTKRKFRNIYRTVMNKPASFSKYGTLGRSAKNYLNQKNGGNNNEENDGCALEVETCIFRHPFNELLVWAVLTKRQPMALLMWQHGEEALAKALIACKLYRALAHEAADDDLEMQIYDELRRYSTEFEDLSLELLDFCYRQDDQLAQQLLTCFLPNWSRQTCLGLAAACNHRSLLAHPCSQLILADLWMGGLHARKYPNLKVVLSLLFPPLILKLEFKTVEELQLMPQTEEEHLIGIHEFKTEDETSSLSSSVDHIEEGFSPQHEEIDVTKFDEQPKRDVSLGKDFLPVELSLAEPPRRKKPLSLQKKLYEFYAAPITTFWAHSMAYVAFLMIYTYVMLVRLPDDIGWAEGYIIAFIGTLGMEKIREVLACEPVQLDRKLDVWASHKWNVCDAVAIIEFIVGLVIRSTPGLKDHGRVLYCLNIVYWYIRILRILATSKFLGPFVTMIRDMVKNMIYFVTLLTVVIMAYGVFRQSLLFPNEEPSWMLARHIFFQPYFMIYGELFADDIDPPCGEGTDIPCVTGRWLNPLVMTPFLLMANIVLINLLIAVFNSIFIKANVNSQQIWKFNRFGVVMEYEEKPTLPPPFIVFAHLYLVLRWCRRGYKESYDRGLKLFLNNEDLERLYDFEEECMENLAQEKEIRSHQSVEERVVEVGTRIEQLRTKVDTCFQKSVQQDELLQSLRLQLEEVNHQTISSLQEMLRLLESGVKSASESLNLIDSDTNSAIVTPENFASSLSVPPDVRGRRSSCAIELDDSVTSGDIFSHGDKIDGVIKCLHNPENVNETIDILGETDRPHNDVPRVTLHVQSPVDDKEKRHSPSSIYLAAHGAKSFGVKSQLQRRFRTMSESCGNRGRNPKFMCANRLGSYHWLDSKWDRDAGSQVFYDDSVIPQPCANCESSENKGEAGNDKVQAEANHLREVEGYDYKMMEDVIESRMQQDVKSPEAFLEDLCYIPSRNVSISTVDETPDTTSHRIFQYVIEGRAMESDNETVSDITETLSLHGGVNLRKMATRLSFFRKLRRMGSSSVEETRDDASNADSSEKVKETGN